MSEARVKVADMVAATSGIISTIGLGSCIAIALYDPVARVGGLAHVLLPDPEMARDRSNPAKFPATAIPLLLEQMTALGASRERVRAKIAGGASMFANLLPRGALNVGDRNIAATREVLALVRVPIVGEDVGADHGRSVFLHLEDGRVEVRSLKRGTRVL
ncbi:MAG TPA: chemotaxis protein CheD [Gemmatimonadaceae bacterium]|jgi:chemotaxis protein CheD|nr:chemotaxis protein CheD [Gemmatimonadaceae bacterium]